MQKLWFKRKTYVWGWAPASWEGWIVTGVYALLVILCALKIEGGSTFMDALITFILPVIVLTIILVGICYRTGESPRWQWGRTKDE